MCLFNKCECGGLHYFYGLDGGGLPSVASFISARQGQAGLFVFSGLLLLEPLSDWPTCGCGGSLCLGATLFYCCSLSVIVVCVCVMGLEARHRFHGQFAGGMALPGHHRSHLVLQLVQRVRRTHQRQGFHLPHIYDHRHRHPYDNLVDVPRRRGDSVIRRQSDNCNPTLLRLGASDQNPLLLLFSSQTVATTGFKGGCRCVGWIRAIQGCSDCRCFF